MIRQFVNMNSAMQKDKQYITKLNNDQREKEGAGFSRIRDFIETETNKGEQIVNRFLKTKIPFPLEKKSDQKFLSNVIMQLLYFRFRIMLTKKLFTSWHDDELINVNQNLSDEHYRKHANIAKYYHEMQKSEIITDLIEFTLTLKLGDKSTPEKAIKIYTICNRNVGENLLKGKYIKSLKGF